MTELLQKRWPNTRKFTLTSDKLIVEYKTLRKNYKFEIKLDKVGLNLHYQSDNIIPGRIFIGICFAILGAMILAYLAGAKMDKGTLLFNLCLWSLIALIAYFKHHQNDVYLMGGERNIVFYQNIPNEEAVSVFINKVRSQVKTYLKEKYTYFDSATTDYDFYHRISWLRDNEIITLAEFVEYKVIFDMSKEF